MLSSYGRVSPDTGHLNTIAFAMSCMRLLSASRPNSLRSDRGLDGRS